MTQVVLITGGTSGIGLALAKALLSQGHLVAVCARSIEGLARFSGTYPQALAVQADITSADSRDALLDAVSARFGTLDMLINNAGSFIERDFRSGHHEIVGLEEEIALNLTAPIHLTGAVLSRWPTLGAVVFVTSGYALVSPARAPTYGAVKAGLHGFADGLRRQLAGQRTQVLELLPPVVDTPMTSHLAIRKLSPDAVAKVMLKALERRKPMALPGQARLLPTLLRIAPKTIGRLVGGT